MSIKNLLEGKVAIITGASEGIGQATALLFAEAGAAVILAARREANLQMVANQIKESGGKILAIATDVTDQADVDLLITLTLRAFRKIDILVNNAGVINPIGNTWQVHPGEWQNLLKVNVVGPYLCARAVLPHMLERGDGRIINVSSGAAVRAIPSWSAYCTSKAALDQFTKTVALEVAHTHVVVASIYPGSTDTPMQALIRDTREAAFERGEHFRTLYNEGRLYPPEEPAQLNLWLASEFGQDQNGTILNIDDQAVKDKIAQDLGLPVIPNRKG